MKKIALIILIGLCLCFGSAFGQCSLSTIPPIETVQVAAGSIIVERVFVQLTNEGATNFLTDHLEIGPMLNDGKLVTTSDFTPDNPVPIGGVYNFYLHFDASAARVADEGVRCDSVWAFTTGGQCAFKICVNVWTRHIKGDLNRDGQFTPADGVLLLNCVFLGGAFGNPDACLFDVADVNCSGNLSPSDIVIELNWIFLNIPLPC